MKPVIFILFLVVLICNCTSKEFRLIEANKRSNLIEVRLGQTNYYIKLDDDFVLTQAEGKEGQLGFVITTKDTSSNISGFIEIDKGQRLHDKIDDWGTLKEKVQSKLLNRKAVWKIFQTETNRYVAETSIKGIYADVSAANISEIDSLIFIISTLSKI